MRLAVEGLIGAGKSRLLEAIRAGMRDRGLSAVAVSEPVGAWQHLLGRFYADRDRWAFPLQMCVLEALLDQADALRGVPAVVTERSHHSAVNVFARLNLHADELAVLRRRYERAEAWRPDCVVFLETPVDTCLARIAQRHRLGEEGVDADYLWQLSGAYEDYLHACSQDGIRVVRIAPEEAADTLRVCDRVLKLVEDVDGLSSVPDCCRTDPRKVPLTVKIKN